MQSIASSATLANLFKNYFKVAKICWLFAQLCKNLIDCFVLEFSTVDTVSRICIAIQEKENEILDIGR